MEWIPDLFVPFGYAGVGQDMRGTEKSQGNFTLWHQDADDSRDLGDWIVNQEWSDGRIFTFGASADGLESLMTPMTSPEWLKGQYIVWCPAIAYDILMSGGTYKQKTVEDWLHGITMPDPDVVNDNIQTVHENEAHTPFWRVIELDDDYYAKIKWPSAFWAGWYDLFSVGTLEAWEGFNTKSDPSVRYTSKIIVDPLGHCLEGAEFFLPNSVMGRTALVLAQAYETFGIYDPKREEIGMIKNVTYYVMSSDDEAGTSAGQYWTSLEKFPEYIPTSYYFSGDGTASTNSPTSSTPASTTYKYDPSNPIPTLGGNNLPASIGGSIPCGPLDQQSIDSRSDMVVFNVAKSDSEITMTGPLFAELYVSSDMIDTDFMVRISDVYNDDAGTVRLLSDNSQRMRWRENGLNPVPMENGEIYKIEIPLWNTSYVVAPGHHLRFVVQSSNFPRFSVNNNNGVLLKDPSYPGDINVALNTIYHSAKYPSRVILPIIKEGKNAQPEVNLMKEVQKKWPHITDDLIKKAEKWITKKLSKQF